MMNNASCMRSVRSFYRNSTNRIVSIDCKAASQWFAALRLSMKCKHEAGGDDVGHGQRQQEFPSKRHELVITEARQRAANPYIEKDEKEKGGQGKEQ